MKRARYAAELAEAATGRPARRFAKTAAQLHDVLGEHQDAVVAESRLRALAGSKVGGLDRSALQRLVARQRGRRRAARAAFQDQWPKLERRGRKAWDCSSAQLSVTRSVLAGSKRPVRASASSTRQAPRVASSQ